MNEEKKCAAHDLLLQNVADIKKGQSQLYDLDREKADRLSGIEISVVKLESVVTAGFAKMEAVQAAPKDLTAQIAALAAIVAKLEKRRRWTPKQIIALIATIFGSGGTGYAIAVAIIGRLTK